MRASIKERKLVQGVLEGKSMRQAAKEAGYAKSTAEVKSYGILKRPRVQSLLPDARGQAGIMPERLAQVLADPLDATRTIEMKNGTREVPDHRIRLDADEQATRAYGVVPKSQELPEPPPPGLSVVIHVVDLKDKGGKPHEPREGTSPAGALPALKLAVADKSRDGVVARQ